uniref:Coiled-coil domain-containing protein 60 n=1 Tax=Biomphalaria glabrata TaxID=6526 RepID=A0A2C9LQV8_BIOGL
MPSSDPRSYVKAVPLPIPSQKGIHIQARSDKVFNPCVPSREDVRKWNYDRRLQQMKDQGFYALNCIPYKGLGDPIYLDEKKMVLDSLGQLTGEETESSSSSNEEEEEICPAIPATQASLAAAKSYLSRTRKDLNTLNKELVKGRSMIRNVQLGHSLFYMIKQERLNKKAAKEEEMRQKIELARTALQPPKSSSSEDETDTEEDTDRENIDNYLGADILALDHPDLNPDELNSVGRQSRSLVVSAKSVMSLRRKKKKKPLVPRPYTPMHTNLAEITAEKEEISCPAIFRQLCVLNWILDAMNNSEGNNMGPISTCWRLNELEIGGYKVPVKKIREDKKSDWEKFVTSSSRAKKESVSKYLRLSRPSQRHLTHPRMSIQSNLSPSSSSTQVNIMEQPTDNQGENIPAADSMSDVPETDEDEALYKTSVFKFLDEYYDSLRHQAELEEQKKRAFGTGEASTDQEQIIQSEPTKHKHRDGYHSKNKSEKHIPKQESESSKSRSLDKSINNAVILSKNSQAEQPMSEDNKAFNRRSSLVERLHEEFKETREELAMHLHGALDQMERERYTKCQKKFSTLNTGSVSFHRAVEAMRKKGRQLSIRPEDIRRQSSFKGHWYSDLLNSLPYDLKDLWYYKIVLHKLSKHGLVILDDDEVGSLNRHSVLNFLKALQNLRTWEICHPDISAAIEFCREKIVDMTVKEYEDWFSKAFPQIHRPMTAPAVVSRGHVSAEGKKIEPPKSAGSNNYRLGLGINSRANSFVSVANGSQGRVRMTQSAVLKT